jgi:hypothetical protein
MSAMAEREAFRMQMLNAPADRRRARAVSLGANPDPRKISEGRFLRNSQLPFLRRLWLVTAMSALRLQCVCAALLIAAAQSAHAIGKGHQILLHRGLQSFALANTGEPFSVGRVQGANFTGVMWIWNSYDAGLLGPAPGIHWSRWVDDPGQTGAGNLADMPPTTSTTNEAPYMANLVSLALGDEQDLNNPTYRANMANWFNTVRANYPATILWTNNWGLQLTDAAFDDYIQTSDPDMLSMDTYQWVVGNGPSAGGSPAWLYKSMRQVRAFGTQYGKPYQLYTQTYHAGVEGDGLARRDPSDSELRLNYFGAVAFGFTSFANFRYGSGNTSLFTGGTGDTTTTPLYNTMTDINAKLKKLSPALTRLVPRTNPISGYDAGMLYYPGQHSDGATTSINDLANPAAGQYYGPDFRTYPGDFSTYWLNTNDPYLRGVTVTSLSAKNDGLRGDVWMMWFKPLDESLDGPGFSNQVYVMICNGLTDPNGSGAECRQRISLNYLDVADATDELLVLNQQSGQIDTYVPPTGSGRRLPVFDLDGGEMVLYKFSTGAPFVGFHQTASRRWALYD